MHPDCESAVAEAIGRPLQGSEPQEIEDQIKLQMRLLARKDPQGWVKLSPVERLARGAEAAATAMIHDIQLKQRRIQLQIAAHDRAETSLRQAFDQIEARPKGAKPGQKLNAVSQLLAFDPVGHNITSAETWSHAIANEAIGRLLPLWQSVKGIAHLFENRQGVSDLVHELFGERTGNEAAAAGARAWLQVTDDLRDRANGAGMDVGKLEEWHYPQSHSQARIAAAGKTPEEALAKWTADTLPLLDRSKYLHADGTRFNEAEMTEFLQHAFDSIITDGQNKALNEYNPERGTLQQSYGIGSIANRGGAHRAIFFKNADSYLTYQGLYGERSLWSALMGHIHAVSRDIGLVETLGPNPEQTFRYFNERTLLDELRTAPKAEAKIRTQAALNESIFDYVSGKRAVVNDKIAAIGQAWRNMQTASKLGRVAITAIGDEAGMSATAFANRVPWSEAFLRELTYLNPANAEDRDIAARNGVGINSMIGGLNRYGTEDLQLAGGEGTAAGVRNFTSKLATGVLQASGAETMWDARRRALGSVLMSYLGKWTRQVEHFADINQQDHGMLATKGITETNWQVWRRAQLEDWGMQHGVLTPKSVYAIPDEQLRDLGDPTQLKRAAATALLGHVLEETGMGVMDTGARERARMLFGTTAGTTAGELARSVFLFKSFSFSMMMKHWARAAAMPTGRATAAYVARLITTATIMGALATQIRSLVSGEDPANIAEPQFWGQAFLRGGGLGFYGDFLYSQLTSYDTSLIPALIGPLATDAEQVWQLSGGAAFKHAQGQRVYEGAKLIRFARSELPFANMWYTQAAFDHLVWNEMQEAASPGYLERMRQKAFITHGTSYWWKPGESAPSRAPDLGKAWQPDLGAQQMAALEAKLGQDTGQQ